MEIGNVIRELRKKKGITQENLAADLGVSAQTISRWENQTNYPDLTMIPVIASYFSVTADYLLGVKEKKPMPKLISTIETFETASRSEAEELVKKFQDEPFPQLDSWRIYEENGKTFAEVKKIFHAELDQMRF